MATSKKTGTCLIVQESIIKGVSKTKCAKSVAINYVNDYNLGVLFVQDNYFNKTSMQNEQEAITLYNNKLKSIMQKGTYIETAISVSLLITPQLSPQQINPCKTRVERRYCRIY